MKACNVREKSKLLSSAAETDKSYNFRKKYTTIISTQAVTAVPLHVHRVVPLVVIRGREISVSTCVGVVAHSKNCSDFFKDNCNCGKFSFYLPNVCL